MTPPFAGVLFDLDGVLVDAHRAVVDLWAELARRCALRLTDDMIREHIVGTAPEETVARLFAHVEPARRESILTRVRVAEPDLALRPLAGASRLVRALAAAEVPVAVVTSASHRRTRRALGLLGLTGQVRASVVWEDITRGKPAPDGYLIGAQRLGVPPHHCLVFEDAANGVTAAVAAGAHCVGVGADPAPLLARGARCVVPSLTDVACRGVAGGAILRVGAGWCAPLRARAAGPC